MLSHLQTADFQPSVPCFSPNMSTHSWKRFSVYLSFYMKAEGTPRIGDYSRNLTKLLETSCIKCHPNSKTWVPIVYIQTRLGSISSGSISTYLSKTIRPDRISLQAFLQWKSISVPFSWDTTKSFMNPTPPTYTTQDWIATNHLSCQHRCYPDLATSTLRFHHRPLKWEDWRRSYSGLGTWVHW